ncbi:MAG: mechanosensitive ion channel [Clostridia bacterium]|nr:mechanosensitive ion channel [Clostridia bacterium]
MAWNKIWDSIVSFFANNIWNIVLFVSVFIIGYVVLKLLLNITRRVLGKTKMEKITQSFLMTAIKLVLYLIFVLILLSMIGVEITGILTTLSALLLAVGMALQNIIANAANGIVVVSTHMFKKGDYIIVNGVEGSITEINFLFTTIMTTDNKRITIPNSTIVNDIVVNSGHNEKRRVDFTFSVAYETDIEKVKSIVTDVMKSDGRVHLDPEPFCRLKVLGASSIDFFANCWCDTEDYWSVYYYIIETVYNEFKRNNISIPYNQLEIRERKDDVKMPVIGEGIPDRIEKQRNIKKGHFDIENADLTKIFKRKNNSNNELKQNKKTRKTKK